MSEGEKEESRDGVGGRVAALEAIVQEAIENLEARARNYDDDGQQMLAQGARDFARHLRQRLAESTGDSASLDR